MFVKLITLQWARILHSKRIAFLCTDVPINSGEDTLAPFFREGILVHSDKIIRRIRENLNFADRFFRKKGEIILDALNLILVERIFPVFENLIHRISPRIDLPLRSSSTAINLHLNLFKSYFINAAKTLKLLTTHINLNNQAIQKNKDILCISRSFKHDKLSSWYRAEKDIRGGQISDHNQRPSLPITTIESKDKNILPRVKQIKFRRIIQDEFSRLMKTLNSTKKSSLANTFPSFYTKNIESGHFNIVQEMKVRKESYTLKSKIIDLIHRHSHDIYWPRENISKIPTTRLLANNEELSTGKRRMPVTLTFIKRYRDQQEVHLNRDHSLFYPTSQEFVKGKVHKVEKQVSRREIEKAISEKVFKTLDKTIEERVHKQLRLDSNYTMHLTEKIYSQLFNRIVLEKERLGEI